MPKATIIIPKKLFFDPKIHETLLNGLIIWEVNNDNTSDNLRLKVEHKDVISNLEYYIRIEKTSDNKRFIVLETLNRRILESIPLIFN